MTQALRLYSVYVKNQMQRHDWLQDAKFASRGQFTDQEGASGMAVENALNLLKRHAAHRYFFMYFVLRALALIHEFLS